MFRPEAKFTDQKQKEEKIVEKTTEVLRKEFLSCLSGKDEELLAGLENHIEIAKNPEEEFLRRQGGLDLSILLSGDSFMETEAEGVVVFDPTTFNPKIIVKVNEGESKKSIADKICHEAIHYLGFRIEEIDAEKERIKFDLPGLEQYEADAFITYRCGPIKGSAIRLCLKTEPNVKLLIYTPSSSDAISVLFWEGAVDYMSKRIIGRLELEGEYEAGYKEREGFMVGKNILEHLLIAKLKLSQEEVMKQFDGYLVAALLGGADDQLSKLVNRITIYEFVEQLYKTADRFKEAGYKNFAERIRNGANRLKMNWERDGTLTTYECFKKFVSSWEKQLEDETKIDE